MAVLAVMQIFIIIYTWRVRKKSARLETDLEEYAEELDTIFKNSHDPIPEDFFTNIESSIKIRRYLLQQYIEEHCMTKTYPHKKRIVKYAAAIGLTDQLRKHSQRGEQWARAEALRILAEVGTEEDIALFRHTLEHSHFKPELIAAVAGLAKDDVIDQVKTAVIKIYDDKNPNRDEILAILAYYSDGAIDHCLEMISDEETPLILKATLIDFVGVKKAKTAAPLLEELLARTDNSELDLHLIEALEKVGTEKSCAVILPFLTAPDFRVRLKAVNALERLAKDKYLNEAEVLLSDENLFVRRNAAEAMSRMGHNGMEKLKTLISSENNDISIITKMVIAEKKYDKIRWRFRYGDTIP
jgi:hypothetical protein